MKPTWTIRWGVDDVTEGSRVVQDHAAGITYALTELGWSGDDVDALDETGRASQAIGNTTEWVTLEVNGQVGCDHPSRYTKNFPYPLRGHVAGDVCLKCEIAFCESLLAFLKTAPASTLVTVMVQQTVENLKASMERALP